MRHFLLTILSLVFLYSANAQMKKIDYILNSETLIIDKLDEKQKENAIFIPTQYGQSKLSTIPALHKIQDATILTIELFFTTFKKEPTFNQKALNRKRLQALHQLLPTVFENDLVEWKMVGQHACNSISEGRHYFHGFVITYRPKPTAETTKKEIDYIEKVLTHGNLDIDSPFEMEGETGVAPFFEGELDSYGGDTLGRYSNFNSVPDSTIYKIFNRHPNWNQMAVICDFTGSMSPYTAQLLLWHKLNLSAPPNRIKQFTFFNDGDNKTTRQKIIGQTGGIYQSQAKSFEEIKTLAIKTMKGGFGGDLPENNIEATIAAIKQCPNCEEIVMIADNIASPRDISLLMNVKKPIKVIVCGVYGGINPIYLDIARQTKGSIHTMEEDILNLTAINEGGEIEIEGRWYQIRNGQFERLFKI